MGSQTDHHATEHQSLGKWRPAEDLKLSTTPLLSGQPYFTSSEEWECASPRKLKCGWPQGIFFYSRLREWRYILPSFILSDNSYTVRWVFDCLLVTFSDSLPTDMRCRDIVISLYFWIWSSGNGIRKLTSLMLHTSSTEQILCSLRCSVLQVATHTKVVSISCLPHAFPWCRAHNKVFKAMEDGSGETDWKTKLLVCHMLYF